MGNCRGETVSGELSVGLSVGPGHCSVAHLTFFFVVATSDTSPNRLLILVWAKCTDQNCEANAIPFMHHLFDADY